MFLQGTRLIRDSCSLVSPFDVFYIILVFDLCLDTATGRTQWESPVQNSQPDPQAATPPAAAAHHSKRRQYAAEQSKAYYGVGDGYSDPNYAAAPGAPGAPPPPVGGQLFTPGLAAENQFAAQQTQQQPQYVTPAQPEYINAPGFGQSQQPPSQPQMGAMTEQFSQMGINQGQKPFALYTTNLLTAPPDPRELSIPPPEIRLPPNACISPSPFANADPSYHRCTMNAIPTTSALLNKSKIPLALISTPYRSIKEGDPPVPIVTDTVIARCRRCRSYINPFVQFIDGGNRWRCTLCMMSNEVPQMFDWDQERNQPGDRWSRAELNHAVVEYVAPTEYMVRPPQPMFYCFLIDVSHAAVSTGEESTFQTIFILMSSQVWSLLPVGHFSSLWTDFRMRITGQRSRS